MRAYIVASGVRIAPFGDAVADLPVGNEPLGALQERLFRRFGLRPERVASLAEIGCETLVERIVEDASKHRSMVVGRAEIGAWTRIRS